VDNNGDNPIVLFWIPICCGISNHGLRWSRSTRLALEMEKAQKGPWLTQRYHLGHSS
jgi:hypothetical protein